MIAVAIMPKQTITKAKQSRFRDSLLAWYAEYGRDSDVFSVAACHNFRYPPLTNFPPHHTIEPRP